MASGDSVALPHLNGYECQQRKLEENDEEHIVEVLDKVKRSKIWALFLCFVKSCTESNSVVIITNR